MDDLLSVTIGLLDSAIEGVEPDREALRRIVVRSDSRDHELARALHLLQHFIEDADVRARSSEVHRDYILRFEEYRRALSTRHPGGR